MLAAFWNGRVGRERGTKVINYAFREGIEGIQRWKMKKRRNKKFSLPPPVQGKQCHTYGGRVLENFIKDSVSLPSNSFTKYVHVHVHGL